MSWKNKRLSQPCASTCLLYTSKNNAAECVLISPDEYVRLMDELNDARLIAIASDRMAHFDPSTLISEEEMNRRLGVTEDDLSGFDEFEIE